VSATERRDGRSSSFNRYVGAANLLAGVEARIVEGALTRVRRQRLRHQMVWGLAAAALLAGGGTGLWLIQSASFLPVGGDTSNARAVPPGAATAHQLWRSSADPVRFRLGHHHADLSAWTTVEATSSNNSHQLRIRRGTATVEVEALQKGDSFVVQTRHFRLEVIGTRFSVSSDDRCSQVRVREGEVRIVERATSRAQVLGANMERSICSRSRVSQGLGKGGVLVQEALNLLSADRDLARADSLLRRYLEHYTDGPFAEEALFHLIHVKSRRGQRVEARKQAAEFLRRFSSAPRAARVRTWLEQEGRSR
jgi:FecR protein